MSVWIGWWQKQIKEIPWSQHWGSSKLDQWQSGRGRRMMRLWDLRRWRCHHRHGQDTEKLLSFVMWYRRNSEFRLGCIEYKVLVGTSRWRSLASHWLFIWKRFSGLISGLKLNLIIRLIEVIVETLEMNAIVMREHSKRELKHGGGNYLYSSERNRRRTRSSPASMSTHTDLKMHERTDDWTIQFHGTERKQES